MSISLVCSLEECEQRKRTKRSGKNTEQQETARAIIFLQLGIRNSVNSSDVGEAIKRLLDILVKIKILKILNKRQARQANGQMQLSGFSL